MPDRTYSHLGLALRVPSLKRGNAFLPPDLDGLALWLDADDGGTLYQDSGGTTPAAEDGDVVGLWQDKSGQVNHLSQATTANKPTLKKSVVGSLDIVRFAGSHWLAKDKAGLIANSDFTVFVVVKYNSTTGDTTYGEASVDSNTPFYDFRLNRISVGDITQQQRDDSSTVLQQVNDSNWNDGQSHVVVGKRSGNDFSMYIDNVAYFEDEAHTIGQTTVTRIGVGALLRATPTAFFSGDFCELCIYTSALSDGERAKTESYLASKWGITL